MRKGFILTLTALVTAFLVTSAVALGPTVNPVPDVYIGPAAAAGAPAETGINMFRYSTALLLWDYVDPGVTTGDGSTSDTLYWGWAAKNADPSGPTGSFLDPLTPGEFHYSIIQENAVDAQTVLPAGEIGDPGWVADINGKLSLTASYSVGEAGQLTFRNIRLSPLPDQASYPAPTAVPGLPVGYLDFQEATIYVSDGNTTPGTDQVNLVTLDAGPDYLSGGPVFEMVSDYSGDTSGWGSFKLAASLSIAAGGYDGNPAGVTLTNSGTGTVSIGMAATNTNPAWYMYGKWTAAGAVDAGNIYRISASLTAAATGTFPSAYLGFNGRSASPATGFGLTQVLAGNLAAGPAPAAGYLVPTATGTADSEIGVIDTADTQGGTLTATDVIISRVDLAEVIAAATSVYDATDFNTVDTPNGTDWSWFEASIGTSLPTFTETAHPSTGNASLSISATTSASDPLNIGFAGFGSGNIAVTAGKLIVVRAGLRSTSADTATIPSPWLNIDDGTQQANMLWDRDALGAAGSGPTASAKDFFAAYEAASSNAVVAFRVLADKTSINGNVTMDDITVYELDVPSGP